MITKLKNSLKNKFILNKEDPFHSFIMDLINFDGILTSDGWRYQALYERSVPKPYNYRWLIPKIAKQDRRRWSIISISSILLMIPGMRWLTGRWSSGLFLFGLSGIWPFAKKYPVLVDPPAMASAIIAAAAVKHKKWPLAIAASIFSGASKEIGPIFASLYAWHPLPLIGLISPLVRHFYEEGEDVTDDYSHQLLKAPFRNAWSSRIDKLYDPNLWLTPWGVCLLGFFKGDIRTISTLSVAYAQCVRSNDSIRLYQWAWPVLAENTLEILPKEFWFGALTLHMVNPLKGNGG